MLRYLVCATLAIFCGCSTVTIHKEVSGENKRLPGIPFYVKRAVIVQTTKRRVEEASIRFVATDLASGRTVSYPASGPIRVPRNDCVDSALEKSRKELDEFATGQGQPHELVATIVQGYQVAIEECSSNPARQILTANSWKVTTAVDPTPHYLSPKRPLMGSSTVSADLASDGTLTKSSVAMQDDTLSTLVPLLPVTKYFERRLGLDKAPDTSTDKAFAKSVDVVRVASPSSRNQLRVSIEIELDPTVYTLEKQHPYPSDSKNTALQTAYVPLNLVISNGTFEPPIGVQLVSVETSSATKKDPDKNAYTLSGSITPPAPTTPQ